MFDFLVILDTLRLPMKSAANSPSFTSILSMQALRESPQTPGSLAKIAGVSSAAVTGVVDSLVKAGLAARANAAEGDRRTVNVEITEKGKVWIASVEKKLSHMLPVKQLEQALATAAAEAKV